METPKPKYCLFCDDGCESYRLIDLPQNVNLHGVWERCQTEVGVVHPIGIRAVDQYNQLTHIDWGQASA